MVAHFANPPTTLRKFRNSVMVAHFANPPKRFVEIAKLTGVTEDLSQNFIPSVSGD